MWLNSNMSRNAYINKDIPLSKIHEVKADLKYYIEFYKKITFIEDIYAGETVKYAIEKRGKNNSNWSCMVKSLE